jgi:hypothetical protein
MQPLSRYTAHLDLQRDGKARNAYQVLGNDMYHLELRSAGRNGDTEYYPSVGSIKSTKPSLILKLQPYQAIALYHTITRPTLIYDIQLRKNGPTVVSALHLKSADASMRCIKPAICFRQGSRLSCYQSHRRHLHTALPSAEHLPNEPDSSVMSVSTQPSALTFELKARCSVSVAGPRESAPS